MDRVIAHIRAFYDCRWTMLCVTVFLTVFLDNLVRMQMGSVLDGSGFRFFFTYLGGAVVSGALVGPYFFFASKSQKKILFFVMVWMAFTNSYDFFISDMTFQSFKECFIHKKLNQGLFSATMLMVSWTALYRKDNQLAKYSMVMTFWMLFLFNIILIFLYLKGFLEISSHASLNNNRASYTFFVFASALLVTDFKKGLESTHLLMIFISFFALALFYSSRSSILGGILVLSVALLFPLKSGPKSKLIILFAVIFGIITFWDVGKGGFRSSIVKLSESVNIEKLYLTSSVRKVRVGSHLNSKLENTIANWFVMAEEPGNENGYKIITLNKDSISSLSRITNIVKSIDSFIERPLGIGFFESKKQVLFGHPNHSVFFIFLQSYGIFFLLFFIGSIIFLPVRHLSVTGTVMISLLFSSNFIVCCLLPMMSYFIDGFTDKECL